MRYHILFLLCACGATALHAAPQSDFMAGISQSLNTSPDPAVVGIGLLVLGTAVVGAWILSVLSKRRESYGHDAAEPPVSNSSATSFQQSVTTQFVLPPLGGGPAHRRPDADAADALEREIERPPDPTE